ncbi:PLP-dependent aminotransferase family protein [Bosea sp. 685]|uniref:aminotransferase-like domain-containing protein n=1 Tax=Bosea sp. 685 TaxID=3080057 RepID=UPI0028936375|nr:PLP-dependent aminotransferase family protein [Bosea sp. 685]WNJ88866.1 PLP-dependent aminotransferase family protein [Bosea sp. 685]
MTQRFLAAGANPELINLAGGLPAPQTYPVPEIAAIAKQVIETHPVETLGYGPIEGLPSLRRALAQRLSSRALRLTPENILVTTSGMQGLDLVGKVLLEEGGIVAGQFPTYLGALDAWRPRRPAFRNLVLESPEFDPVAAMAGAQFTYTVPNFSNPSGRLVDMALRERLVDAAQSTGVWLVEDDPYGGLHYDRSPLPRLIDLSAERHGGPNGLGGPNGYGGPVIYTGTLSKAVAPGLRIGWVVAAPEMIRALTTAKQGSDMCTSGVTQHIALAALENGLIERVQPVIVELYRKRRDALCLAMKAHLSAWFDWEVPVGGMFVWAVARDPSLDTERLFQLALEAGVCIAPSSVFDASGRNRSAMRLNFTLNPPERLDEGVRRLAEATRHLCEDKA